DSEPCRVDRGLCGYRVLQRRCRSRITVGSALASACGSIESAISIFFKISAGPDPFAAKPRRSLTSQRRSAEDLGAWEMVIHANSLFWPLTQTPRLSPIPPL